MHPIHVGAGAGAGEHASAYRTARRRTRLSEAVAGDRACARGAAATGGAKEMHARAQLKENKKCRGSMPMGLQWGCVREDTT
jgi:hypothetical protein